MRVAVLMGSPNDREKMAPASKTLEEFVEYAKKNPGKLNLKDFPGVPTMAEKAKLDLPKQ